MLFCLASFKRLLITADKFYKAQKHSALVEFFFSPVFWQEVHDYVCFVPVFLMTIGQVTGHHPGI